MTLTAAQTDRAAGVLRATAVGDALGAGYEFSYPDATATISMIGGGMFGFEPGEWTDDTSMAVAVAMVAAAGLDVRSTEGLDAVAAGFVERYDAPPKRPPRRSGLPAVVVRHPACRVIRHLRWCHGLPVVAVTT